ncbi:MAG: aminotransferase class I and II [Muribaculaceae bacterium]|nr:aminotransferase class I and II [Muribaculaceae bacterium]
MTVALRREKLSRYIAPLREGGSLPALAEAADGFKYVVKFRGGGHGSKALIAEYLGGEIARKAGLKVPELVLLDLDEAFGRTEPDEEVQDLLRASTGLNLGLHFLSGAMAWDVSVNHTDALTASKIVWLDAFITNVDRTFRNTNMLLWNRELWLIDHGSSFFFHHSWDGWEKAPLTPFAYIKDHALLRDASLLEDVDAFMHTVITDSWLSALVDCIPEEWLRQASETVGPQEQREVYKHFLLTRFANSQIFVRHAADARRALV